MSVRTSASLFVVLFLLAVQARTEGKDKIAVCGNYCGPSMFFERGTKWVDWCSKTKINETMCVKTRVWGGPTDGSCADSCCRIHDKCCGDGANRQSCNAALVNCLSATSCYKTICGAVVWAAMKTVSSWCCGRFCSPHLIARMNEFEAKFGPPGIENIGNITDSFFAVNN